MDTVELEQLHDDIAQIKEQVEEIHGFFMQMKDALENNPMASMLLG